jgi:hypothetical protein
MKHCGRHDELGEQNDATLLPFPSIAAHCTPVSIHVRLAPGSAANVLRLT